MVCVLQNPKLQSLKLNVCRASLTHGTPPHINRSQYDVPLPDLESLLIRNVVSPGDVPSTDDRVRGAECFIALCQLTEILGAVLPLIYDIQSRHENNYLRAVRRFESNLDEWEDSLPPWLQPISSQFDNSAPGALSLQLSFFALKMCLSRIALQVCSFLCLFAIRGSDRE